MFNQNHTGSLAQYRIGSLAYISYVHIHITTWGSSWGITIHLTIDTLKPTCKKANLAALPCPFCISQIVLTYILLFADLWKSFVFSYLHSIQIYFLFWWHFSFIWAKNCAIFYSNQISLLFKSLLETPLKTWL
jgi:hypothetical protein